MPLNQVDKYITNYQSNSTSQHYVKHVDGASYGQERAMYKPHVSLSFMSGLSILTFKKQGVTDGYMQYEQDLKYFSHLRLGADLWIDKQVALGIDFGRASTKGNYNIVYVDENRERHILPMFETYTFEAYTGTVRWRFADGAVASTDLLLGFGVTRINMDFTLAGEPGTYWGNTHSLIIGSALNFHITPAIDLQFYPRFITARPKQMEDEFVGQTVSYEYEDYEDRPKFNRIDLSFGITWKL